MQEPDSDSSVPKVDEQLYVELFKSRDDCFAIQRRDGSYAPLDIQFESKHVTDHINGDYTYGQYLVDPKTNTVRFACIDNDIDDDSDAPLSHAFVAAKRERDHANSLGLDDNQLWIEFSGRRGYHLWMFFEKPIPAAHAKALLDEIDSAVEIEGGHTEVFPKQIAVAPGDYGNLVKTPLGLHQKTGNRMVFVDENGDPVENQGSILRAISRNRIQPGTVEEILEEIDHDPEELEQDAKEVAENKGRSMEEVLVDYPEIRPCVEAAMRGEVDHLRGDEGHHMRLAIGAELMAHGVPIEDAKAVFARFDNYDERITTKKLREIQREGHKPWQCSTLKDKCPRYCGDCDCPYQSPDIIDSMELNRRLYSDSWGDS